MKNRLILLAMYPVALVVLVAYWIVEAWKDFKEFNKSWYYDFKNNIWY